ncbi:putative AAA family ATPase [Rosellinia necatrix]|uniref:Putative AAA family ATPase n=1 Tax=Rosellinia necatrix TaxID=77044 RepID=A0A1S8A582_ROSNE|nr:putative AAA family ATPase [Rosellinia necatrix]
MLPSPQSNDFRATAESLVNGDWRLVVSSGKTDRLMRQIKALTAPSSASGTGFVSRDGLSPGGRHDNDFANYRDISTLPTRDELLSREKPFYLHASSIAEADAADRIQIHLDNQYRLVREDMIGDMQEEFRNVANGKKRRGFRNTFIQDMSFVDFDKDTMGKERPCTIIVQCNEDILEENLKIQGDNTFENRKKALKRVPAFFRHLSFGCLVKGNNVLGFASVDRNEDRLALKPPQICLRVTGPDSLEQILRELQQGRLDYLQLSTPVFAYEPILERLQRKTDIELADDILGLSNDPQLSRLVPQALLNSLRGLQPGSSDLQHLLKLSKPVSLDPSQVQALVHGLTYRVGLIQGPPGTGKSLVGALLTKALVDNTNDILLVLSFTNHALDQFIEDLMDIGIHSDSIVRLGSKSTTRTAPLLLSAQNGAGQQRRWTRYELLDYQRNQMTHFLEMVDESSANFFQDRISHNEILQYLQFSEVDQDFYDALAPPEAGEGETIVGPKGKKMQSGDLFQRWQRGQNAVTFTSSGSNPKWRSVWNLSKSERLAKVEEWTKDIMQDRLRELTTHIENFNKCQKTILKLRQEKTEHILQSKRIIACTTTAASMYASEIQAAAPGVVIVEEAGEILESHILAAMGPTTKHLIQIGDHKQLRPKVKNYKLTVEAGSGYDLNRSLFERLILQDRPSRTLLHQHRMRPEISELVRHNYPELHDAPSTQGRPHLRGFQDDVIFCNHKYPEIKHDVLREKLDPFAQSSKQNVYEADMVLKCIRYLGQQSYKTDDIVILTPYLVRTNVSLFKSS